MTIYLISYDLIDESGSADYEPLWAELKRFDCHRTQLSVWLGNFNNTASDIHDHFRKLLDPNDRLMVCEFTKFHRYTKALPGTTDWLARNPPLR